MSCPPTCRSLRALPALLLSLISACATTAAPPIHDANSPATGAPSQAPPDGEVAAPAQCGSTSITQAQALEAFERFERACRAGDAQAIWSELAASVRARLDEEAERVRARTPEAAAAQYGYEGPLESFAGADILAKNIDWLCRDLESWQVAWLRPTAGYLFELRLPGGVLRKGAVVRESDGALRIETER